MLIMDAGSVQQESSGLVVAHDAHGREIDLAPIHVLLDRIVATWRPTQVFLFGSRARGEAQTESDWDLFAVVPDDVPEDQLGPLASWRLRKESRTRADVVTCHASDFSEDRDTPNTMAYEVAREGVLLYER
jgi:predicted nucleotidyltransferase